MGFVQEIVMNKVMCVFLRIYHKVNTLIVFISHFQRFVYLYMCLSERIYMCMCRYAHPRASVPYLKNSFHF